MKKPMKEPIKELPTFVRRTYRGGKLLCRYLGLPEAEDGFLPEDWISSFTEAKNRDPIPGNLFPPAFRPSG